MSSKIRSCALSILARREHSKFELQKKLNQKGFGLLDIEKLLQDLELQGLQNDSRFIECYINMRRHKGFGPVRILGELQERGIDKEEGKRFLDVRDPVWLTLAAVVRSKKFGKKIPNDLHAKVQQMRYLYYKGFTSDQIKEIFAYAKD